MMTMSLLPGLDCRLTSSPATKKIFNSWTTDDGGPKKGDAGEREWEREREGRKNNPALSCQLSAANEPLLPSSWAVAFRRRLFETEVTARYPPINRLILPHPRYSHFHGCASNYSAYAVESRCICESEWLIGDRRRIGVIDRSTPFYREWNAYNKVIDWNPMEKIYLDRYRNWNRFVRGLIMLDIEIT